MKRYVRAWLTLLMLGIVAGAAAAQQGGAGKAASEPFGTWAGTWDGQGGGGTIELLLEKGKDGGVPGGQVTIGGEYNYKTPLKALTLEGQKITAKYEVPNEPEIEVTLTGTVEGTTTKGTWTAHNKTERTDVATGGWTATKK